MVQKNNGMTKAGALATMFAAYVITVVVVLMRANW